MDNKTNSYASLYSGEVPAGGQTGAAAEYAAQADPEQAALINKGRKKAKVIGVLFVGMVILSSLGDLFDFSQGIAYWAGARLANVLVIAGGVLFIKGNNTARIVLGVIYSAVTLVAAFILVPAVMTAFSMSPSAGAYGLVMTLLILGVCGIFVWFTLFDKSVKAYCKQPKNT
ncbi:MAG: hypothetical protein NC120_08550 [Ruminococcus sp.]|nr:hypothetical protein [Ruminococcus sp.]